LTRLLWATLKRATPSAWRDIGLSDLGFEEDYWEEHFPDPISMVGTDLLGRLTLAGEGLINDNGLNHLCHESTASEVDDKKDLLARLMRASESWENIISLDKLREIVLNQFEDNDNLIFTPARRSAKAFQEATSSLSMEEIVKRTRAFPPIVQMLIYDRLGYKRFPGQLGYRDARIEYFIGLYFKENSRRYYKLVQASADLLLMESVSPEILEKLNKDTEDLIKPGLLEP
jgi:hypothetical protein